MNNQDTFNIICSFLNPKELLNFNILSKIHNKWANTYFTKKFNKINLEEYVCPKCANFLDCKEEDISNYNDFTDYALSDDIKLSRFSSVEEWFNKKNIYDIERSKILCDNCEYEEDYSDNVFLNFKYKGNREYTILYFYSLYSWVSICLTNKNKVFWNEYRKPLSICYKEYIVSEDSNDPYRYSYFNHSFNYEDEDEDEDEFFI